MPKQPKSTASPFDALVKARQQSTETELPAKHLTIQTVKQLDSPTSSAIAKSTDPEFLKFTTYIRRATHRAVKVRLVERGREFSDLVEQLLSDWLQRESTIRS